MKGTNGDTIIQIIGGVTAKGDGEDVNAIFNGGIEASENVCIEALASVDGRPADLVGDDAGSRRAALGRAVAEAENAGVGDEASSGGGQSVSAVAIHVTGAV